MTAKHPARAAIVGTGFSHVERRSHSSLGAHVVDACRRAVEDSGLSMSDIDGLANYPNPSRPVGAVVEGIDVAGVRYVAGTLGLANLRWACSVQHGTLAAALVEAVHAVTSGSARHVLVWRAMYNPPGKFGRIAVPEAEGANEFTYPYGLVHNVMAFAIPYARYLWKYGKSRADMAVFVSKNRDRVVDDPDSVFFRRPVSIDDYLEERMIAAPLSLYDCDMPVTGCGALVVSAADLAKDLIQRPAYIAGQVSLGLPYHNSPVMQYEHLAASGHQTAATLWDNAKLGPSDIDQANVYDGFSYYVPFWLEWLGLCPEGEGLDFLASDETGRIPINTNGGALGRGRLHGTPQVIEAVRQIQGRALHQVSDAHVTLATVGSPSHGAGALVFTDEP